MVKISPGSGNEEGGEDGCPKYEYWNIIHLLLSVPVNLISHYSSTEEEEEGDDDRPSVQSNLFILPHHQKRAKTGTCLHLMQLTFNVHSVLQ